MTPEPLHATSALEPPGVLLSPDCRALRRSLRPLVWVTLEEVAFDAAVEGGRLVARTSARRIAEQLRVDPGTAAGALRVLRDRGLVVLDREPGPSGRFGLSVYELRRSAGLTVVRTLVARPRLVQPCAENADTAEAPSSPSLLCPRRPVAGRS